MSEGEGRRFGMRFGAAASVATGAALLAFAPIGLRLSEVGPQATAFWRFVFALPVLAVAFALERPKPSARDAGLLGWAGIAFGIDIALFHAAVALTVVLNATLLSNMTPIFAAAAGWFLFRERIGGGFAAGAALAVIGALMLALARTESAGAPMPNGHLGDALGLASALGYAAYLVIMSRARRRVGLAAAMFLTTLASLIFVFGTTLATGESFWPETWRGWAVLVGLGLVVHVGGQGLIAAGLGRLPIGLSTVLLWIQPVAAAGVSWVLFGEALGPLALAGAALVLGGIWVVQRYGRAAPA